VEDGYSRHNIKNITRIKGVREYKRGWERQKSLYQMRSTRYRRKGRAAWRVDEEGASPPNSERRRLVAGLLDGEKGAKCRNPNLLYKPGMRMGLEKDGEKHRAWQIPNITNPT
jgi:hypothetical protein